MVNKNSIVLRIIRRALRVIKKIPQAPFFLLSMPFTLILIMAFPFVKIKFIRLCSNRIGHYAMNTELLLCYLDEIKNNEKNIKYYFYLLDAPVCNNQLHTMWKRMIFIVPFTKLISKIDLSLLFIFGSRYKNSALKKFEMSQGNQDINGYFKKYTPHLSFINDEIKRGENLLLQLGIPKGASFVCLYARDATYLNTVYPKNDWSYHFYRDCNIHNFSTAALYLANKGYYVVRMGKVVASAFEVDHPNIIDYSTNQLRSDFGDIYITAQCKFFISTSAGLDGIAQIFRKPILFVNVAPFKNQLQFWYPCEYFITKKFFDKTKNACLSAQYIEEKIKNHGNLQKLFVENNWEILENSADEILQATIEMENYFSHTDMKYSENPFHVLLKKSLTLSIIPERDFLKFNVEKFYIKPCDQFWKN